ncbi:MAG: trypsin-like peptidase domain-containing protein, partial [Anaerolineales bacterium]|nr:trypsin-like peptidase domain-containing protein [Anaerolineales bacterium]
MKRLPFIHWILFMLLVFALAACGGDGGEISFSTANIQNARLAKDEAGSSTTTQFGQEDTIYVLADLNNAPDDTTVKAVFTAVNAEGESPNTQIEEADLTTGSGALTFNLAPSGLWPNGSYKVELYLNDELDQTLTYAVEGPVSAAAEPTDAPETITEPEPTPAADSGINSIEDVRQAVIRIQAQGSFVDPEFGLALNTAGQGTGFIIDESGIAVTNNHVVTGAALLEVWIEGESQPHNAKVLGVSECADLAVIDIDGDGFPALDWYDGPITVGLDVYSAGFPLFGNTEFTLTRGIVSKEHANGDTSWASVDSVIEHDATINPGNSGGPLVSENGRIVGVNYASRSDTNQYFAISRDLARPLIEQMREGNDVQSIGINGEAITDGETFAGIWVSSVESGTPADKAGIRGGDFLTSLEGLVLGVDGTMASYCDILRSRNPEDTMSVEITRFGTGELLEGQLNGRNLEVVGTLQGAQSGGETTGSDGYVTINDDSGQLAVNIPASWAQVDGSAWVNDAGENLGIRVIASPDINGFLTTWATPGVSFRASDSLGMDDKQLIEQFDFSGDCQYGGRESYADQLYSGQYDV